MKLGRIIRKGARIGLVSPASPSKKEEVDDLIKYLEGQGFELALGRTIYKKNKYLAGTDEERAADLNQMFGDPDIDAILCIRGGYGSPRILDLLDYDLIEKNPKVFIGYSDITAIHVALNQKCGLVSYHGPMGSSDMIDGFNPISRENLEAIVMENGRGRRLENPEGHKLEVLRPGSCQGPVLGGNLSLIVDLIGSDYGLDPRGKILFIEEVGEEPRNIDRMLNQMRLCGMFKDCLGVILGDFKNCQGDENSFSLDQVLDQYFGDLDLPVVKNFQAGHCEPMLTIPFGPEIRLDTKGPEILIMEDTVKGD